MFAPPSVVTTYRLVDDGTGYVASETLYDSLFRQREMQSTTPDGNRLVSDTVYDSQGRQLLTTDPYYTAGAVGSTLVKADPAAPVTQNGYLYDGAGRLVSDITYYAAAKQWESDTTYNGADETTTTPPGGAGGGTADSTYTDAAGRKTQLVKYNGSSPSDGVATSLSYSYTPDGNVSSVADAAGDKWTYSYNLLGERTSATDPDTGTTTYTFDAAGQQITATDSTGKAATNSYDAMGRRTGLYDTTGGGAPAASNEVSSWAYDSLAKGLPTSSTSYYNGNAYTSSVIGYTTYGQSKGTTVIIPAAEGKLAGTYVHQTTYTPADQVASTHDGADAGLPAETVTYQYDAFGRPYSLTGSGTVTTAYVSDLTTTQYGQPSVYTFGTTSNPAYLDLSYDDSTGRLTGAATVTTSGGASHTADDLTYTYNQATGNVLSAQDIQSETGTQITDTECFGYDGLQRLASAWTATDNCAATPAPGNSGTVGGINAYWQTFSYDALGDRTSSTDHNTSGITADDVTTSYVYPPAGSNTVQPHTLSSTTTTGPAGSTQATFTYDSAGDTTAISDPLNGNHTMAWDITGKLVSDTTAAGTTGYIYDADGNLLIRHDPKTDTLFLRDEQITQDNGTATITRAVRYYSMDGSVIAARTATSAGATQDVQYLIPDRQGSDTLAIDSVTQAVTRRAFLPYGGARGAAPASWPGGDRGYVGGESDATTGMETLGARQYDPADGRFLSADPLLETADPNQAGGYVYAGDNPTTQSDPTGQGVYDDATGCSGSIQAVESCIRNYDSSHGSSSSSSTPSGSTNTTGGNTNGSGSIDPNACATLECHKELTDAAYAAQARAEVAALNAEAQKELAAEQKAEALKQQEEAAKHKCSWYDAICFAKKSSVLTDIAKFTAAGSDILGAVSGVLAFTGCEVCAEGLATASAGLGVVSAVIDFSQGKAAEGAKALTVAALAVGTAGIGVLARVGKAADAVKESTFVKDGIAGTMVEVGKEAKAIVKPAGFESVPAASVTQQKVFGYGGSALASTGMFGVAGVYWGGDFNFTGEEGGQE